MIRVFETADEASHDLTQAYSGKDSNEAPRFFVFGPDKKKLVPFPVPKELKEKLMATQDVPCGIEGTRDKTPLSDSLKIMELAINLCGPGASIDEVHLSYDRLYSWLMEEPAPYRLDPEDEQLLKES